ncbi:MAG: YbaN family protein [Candidatus Pelethousia sp.]|nr:YbaN family protein [Candidatus Pelethousia sp.]
MRIKTILLTGLGFLFLGLGAIGLLVPVWPTTPFVLLSAACFSSTPRLRAKIMKVPFFREHIENYENRTGLSRKTVAVSLGYLWGMLLLSMLLIRKAWIIGLLCAIGAAVTIHIFCVAKARCGKESTQNETGIRGL